MCPAPTPSFGPSGVHEGGVHLLGGQVVQRECVAAAAGNTASHSHSPSHSLLHTGPCSRNHSQSHYFGQMAFTCPTQAQSPIAVRTTRCCPLNATVRYCSIARPNAAVHHAPSHVYARHRPTAHQRCLLCTSKYFSIHLSSHAPPPPPVLAFYAYPPVPVLPAHHSCSVRVALDQLAANDLPPELLPDGGHARLLSAEVGDGLLDGPHVLDGPCSHRSAQECLFSRWAWAA